MQQNGQAGRVFGPAGIMTDQSYAFARIHDPFLLGSNQSGRPVRDQPGSPVAAVEHGLHMRTA